MMKKKLRFAVWAILLITIGMYMFPKTNQTSTICFIVDF